MNPEVELLQDKGDVPFAIKCSFCNGHSQKPSFWFKGERDLTNFVFPLLYLAFFLIIYYRKMRLRTKKIDSPKINEPKRLTTILTLLNCYGSFYSGNVDFRHNMSKFTTPSVIFNYLHNLSLNLRIGYCCEGDTTDKQINTVHNRKDWRN